jgi:pyrroline-5-carboxylate reductase
VFVEAMIDGGVLSGLPRDVARTLVVETIRGSMSLMEANGEHPAVVRDRITSPAGTTIAGIHQLERLGFRHAVIAAIQAATERSRQLNQPAPNNSIEPA